MEHVLGNEELAALIEEQLWRLQRRQTRPTLYHLRACKLWKRAFALAAAQRRWDSCHRLLSMRAQPWKGDYRSFVPRSIQYIPGDVGAGKLPPQGVITLGWFHASNNLELRNRTHSQSVPLVQAYELSDVIPPKPLLWPSAGTAIGAKNDFHHEPSPRFMGRYAFTGSDGARQISLYEKDGEHAIDYHTREPLPSGATLLQCTWFKPARVNGPDKCAAVAAQLLSQLGPRPTFARLPPLTVNFVESVVDLEARKPARMLANY